MNRPEAFRQQVILFRLAQNWQFSKLVKCETGR